MRYLLILMVALALTIAWQTSVVADIPSGQSLGCASQVPSDGPSTGTGTDGPPCR